MLSSISLNSWVFLGLALAAVLFAQSVRASSLRNVGVLGVSFVFLAFFIPDIATLLVLAVYLLIIYGVGRWKLARGDIPDGLFAGVIIAFWVFLFLIKGPSLLAPLNPFFHFPIHIVGISYITFRAISYFSDIDVIEDQRFVPFVGYMLFFPTLLAGPLARYDDFLESWDRDVPNNIRVMHNLHRIANGAVQKFVISDNIVGWGVFSVGADYAQYHPVLVALSIIVQFFVIFFDFAGYTNMMIGIAGLMGFELPENFNRPWMARNVQEFWQRWHMSMTRFIQDYIYTPLVRRGIAMWGANHAWTVAVVTNFFCMMLIALWHAPTLGYFAFGLAHGLALTLAQFVRRAGPSVGNELTSIAVDWSARVLNVIFISASMVLWQFGPVKAAEILGYAVGAKW